MLQSAGSKMIAAICPAILLDAAAQMLGIVPARDDELLQHLGDDALARDADASGSSSLPHWSGGGAKPTRPSSDQPW